MTNINELIARLINKCNNSGKPIYINVDFQDVQQEELNLKTKEITTNVIDGYDGYIFEFKKIISNKIIDNKTINSILKTTSEFLYHAEHYYYTNLVNQEARINYLK